MCWPTAGRMFYCLWGSNVENVEFREVLLRNPRGADKSVEHHRLYTPVAAALRLQGTKINAHICVYVIFKLVLIKVR